MKLSDDLASKRLDSIFHECNMCGTCCKTYRKILLHEDEAAFITKMGGHVGVDVSMAEIREKGLTQASEEARKKGKIYMIHPDDRGCVFLVKKNDIYSCKIYNYRPRTCRGFKCNLADDSFLTLFGNNSIHLLGQNSFGLPLHPPDPGK